MTRHRYPIVTLVTVMLITGCTHRTSGPTPVASTAGGGETVTVERTGGFAGGHVTMVIEPNGEWTRSDMRRGHLASGKLTEEQQRELNGLLADPHLADEAERGPVETNCRDAFNYRVLVGSIEVNYVDCPSDPDLPATAQQIVALVESATKA